MQNNVYKGKVLPYVTNYNSLAELIWIKMKSNEDKIAQVSQSLHDISIKYFNKR